MPFSGVSLIGLLDSTGLFRHVPHATYSGFKVEREVKLHLRTAKHSLEEPVPKTINSENVKNEISQLNFDITIKRRCHFPCQLIVTKHNKYMALYNIPAK